MGSSHPGEALGTVHGLISTFSLLCSRLSWASYVDFLWHFLESILCLCYKSQLFFQHKLISEPIRKLYSYLKSIRFISEYIQSEDFWVIWCLYGLENTRKYSGSLWGVLDFDTEKQHSTLADNQSDPPFWKVTLHCSQQQILHTYLMWAILSSPLHWMAHPWNAMKILCRFSEYVVWWINLNI